MFPTTQSIFTKKQSFPNGFRLQSGHSSEPTQCITCSPSSIKKKRYETAANHMNTSGKLSVDTKKLDTAESTLKTPIFLKVKKRQT